jgi:signal transduction histidine kinase
MLSLQNRLTLTYALFTSLALGALTLIVNGFTGLIFTALVKGNIAEKSAEIVRVIALQYNPLSRSFNASAIEAMGMYFVHEGYIVTVEDKGGKPVWDARSCNMRQCMEVINRITERMEGRFGLGGSIQSQRFPVKRGRGTVGTVIIETYGPFFYSETETRFLTSINRLLLTASALIILCGIAVSTALSRAIARPILTAAEAARRIAKARAGGMSAGPPPVIRVADQYQTKELSSLSRSINELAAELEAAECRQKQLTADIAHELRTPLACLQGGLEAMLDGVYQASRERLASCHEEIIRLARLVQDLTVLAGLEWENIALNKTEFDLAALLRVTAEQWRPAALEKGIGITLRLQESPIRADYDRLKQVFINLLSNAVKYTDHGGVTISIETSGGGVFAAGKNAEKTQPLCVCVSDTGSGIPQEDLPHIFERFYRADKSRSRSTGGFGIGLAVSAAIIRAHGGTISAESGGAGSVFRIRL